MQRSARLSDRIRGGCAPPASQVLASRVRGRIPPSLCALLSLLGHEMPTSTNPIVALQSNYASDPHLNPFIHRSISHPPDTVHTSSRAHTQTPCSQAAPRHPPAPRPHAPPTWRRRDEKVELVTHPGLGTVHPSRVPPLKKTSPLESRPKTSEGSGLGLSELRKKVRQDSNRLHGSSAGLDRHLLGCLVEGL